MDYRNNPQLERNSERHVVKNKTEGGAKAPRKHKKEWADNTRNERQNTRQEKLNAAARAAGWASWSAYETAVVNGAAQPTPFAPDTATP